MRKQKLIATLLTAAMLISLVVVPAAAKETDNWYDEAMTTWADYGVIQGDANGDLNPEGKITRGELAVILDRLMDYQLTAKNTFTDVKANQWYTDAILATNAAGIVKGDGPTARPLDQITREEAAVMFARVLSLSGEAGASAGYTDEAAISGWAMDAVKSMSAKGYLKGSDGTFRPKDPITRAEVMTILNNVFQGYYNAKGTYSEVVRGTALISAAGVTMKNTKISGDLILAEGVADGEVTLDGVTVAGKLIVRGGGENSIIIKGASSIANVVVSRQDGKVRVSVEGSAKVETIVVADGSDAVKVEGTVNTVTVDGAGAAVEITGTVKNVNVAQAAQGAALTVTKTAKVTNLNTAAEGASLAVAGTVTTVKVADTAADTKVDVAKGATVAKVETAGNGTAITGDGSVKNVDVTAGDGTTVKTPGTKVEVDKNAGGVTTDKGEVKPGTTGSNTGSVPGTSTGGGGGGGGGGSSTPATSITVSDKDALTAALGNSQYSTITISGAIGAATSAETYVSVDVSRAVTIKGGTVYGAINLMTDGITLDGVTINSRGGGDDAMKNAVNVVAAAATIKNCTITAGSAENTVSNAIVIYPTNETVNYVVTGNNISGYVKGDGTWGSSGIAVTEGFDYSARFGLESGTSKVITSGLDDRQIALGNTFATCSNEYVRIDWTGYPVSAANYKFGYYDGGYSSQFTTSTGSATMLLAGTVGMEKDVTYPAGVTIELLADANVTISGSKTITIGGTIQVNEGATLTITEGSTLTNNGTIVANDEAGLKTAIAAGGTVKLGANITATEKLVISVPVTLDLNSKTLTSGATASFAINVTNSSGTVTIKNGTITGSKYGVGLGDNMSANGNAVVEALTIETTGRALQNNKGVLVVKSGTYASSADPTIFNNSTLTIEGGSFSCTAADSGTSVILCKNETGSTSTLNITGGTVTNDIGYGISALAGASVTFGGTASVTAKAPALGGNNTEATENFTITGGTLTSTDSAAIFFPAEGNLTITGGTITGKTGIHALMGTISISGDATITADGDASGIEDGYPTTGSGPRSNGAAILLVNKTYSKCEVSDALTVTVSGGTFSSTAETDITVIEGTKNTDQEFSLKVTGGNYSAKVDESYLETGYSCTASGDKWVVAETAGQE